MVTKGKSRNENIIDMIVLVVGLFLSSRGVSSNLNLSLIIEVVFLGICILLRILISSKISAKPSPYQLWIMSLWILIVLNAVIISTDYFGWKTILIYLLPAISVLLYFSKEKDSTYCLEVFKKGCVLANTVILIVVALLELTHFTSTGFRLGTTFAGNSNTFAIHLCIYSAVVYYDILFENRKRYWPIFVISAIFILLSGSKKGLLGIGIIIGILSFAKYKWKFWKYVLPVAIVVAGVYLVENNSYFYQIMGRRFDAFLYYLGRSEENNSTGMRMGMYHHGWEFFKQSIIWGNGYGYFTAHSTYGTYSHSNYIEMLVSFGLLGTCLYYSIFLKIIRRGLKILRQENYAILFLTLVFVQLFFDIASISFYDNALLYIVLFFASKIMIDSVSNRSDQSFVTDLKYENGGGVY